jgi:hypothetical protein
VPALHSGHPEQPRPLLARKSGAPGELASYGPGMDLRIATITERPALTSRFVDEETEPWPAFMNEDPIAGCTSATSG